MDDDRFEFMVKFVHGIIASQDIIVQELHKQKAIDKYRVIIALEKAMEREPDVYIRLPMRHLSELLPFDYFDDPDSVESPMATPPRGRFQGYPRLVKKDSNE